ncbi:MAG: PIN domain-containing protein [Candidatus Micrarchaeota archaeon]
MLFLDSSFLISYFSPEDGNHGRAVSIWEALKGKSVISDHVLSEVVTLIWKRYNTKRAFEAGQILFRSREIDIVFSNLSQAKEAVEKMKKYGNLSFCDSLSISIMREQGIEGIVSFDSDFDRIGGIQRIH